MTQIDELSAPRVIRLVREALEPLQPRGYRLEVPEDGVRKDDDWWHVLVQPTTDVRSYDFYDILAQAEARLQDEQHLNVLLVPTLAA